MVFKRIAHAAAAEGAPQFFIVSPKFGTCHGPSSSHGPSYGHGIVAPHMHVLHMQTLARTCMGVRVCSYVRAHLRHAHVRVHMRALGHENVHVCMCMPWACAYVWTCVQTCVWTRVVMCMPLARRVPVFVCTVWCVCVWGASVQVSTCSTTLRPRATTQRCSSS